MFGRSTCFCYADEGECRGAFDRLRSGDVRSFVPSGGHIELRKAQTGVPNKYWLLCINLAPGNWLDAVDVSDRYEGSPDKFRGESDLLDSFDT